MDGLSAQSIKSGDTNLVSAIRRVPGYPFKMESLFMCVVWETATETLLGGKVPGLDPDKNTLQLDIFPTNLLDNIIVNKSSSADLNADFSGGGQHYIKRFSIARIYFFIVRRLQPFDNLQVMPFKTILVGNFLGSIWIF